MPRQISPPYDRPSQGGELGRARGAPDRFLSSTTFRSALNRSQRPRCTATPTPIRAPQSPLQPPRQSGIPHGSEGTRCSSTPTKWPSLCAGWLRIKGITRGVPQFRLHGTAVVLGLHSRRAPGDPSPWMNRMEAAPTDLSSTARRLLISPGPPPEQLQAHLVSELKKTVVNRRAAEIAHSVSLSSRRRSRLLPDQSLISRLLSRAVLRFQGGIP